MKTYVCPRCGGHINREKMICEYCGTTFREEQREIRMAVYNPHVYTLDASVTILKEYAIRSPKEISEYAVQRLAQEFADRIAQFMEVQMVEDPKTLEVKFRARLRVLDNEYRFE